MKKTLILMGVVSLLVQAAWAHVPADRTFLAFQWPDSAVPTIDGDLSEWAVVPEVYVVKPEDTHDALYSNVVDKADLDFRGYVGYNDASDKVLMASSVFDDLHERDNTDPGQCNCADDNFEFWIDGDHAGSPYVAEYGRAEGSHRRGARAGDQFHPAVVVDRRAPRGRPRRTEWQYGSVAG